MFISAPACFWLRSCLRLVSRSRTLARQWVSVSIRQRRLSVYNHTGGSSPARPSLPFAAVSEPVMSDPLSGQLFHFGSL